jgi:hypothetical protein
VECTKPADANRPIPSLGGVVGFYQVLLDLDPPQRPQRKPASHPVVSDKISCDIQRSKTHLAFTCCGIHTSQACQPDGPRNTALFRSPHKTKALRTSNDDYSGEESNSSVTLDASFARSQNVNKFSFQNSPNFVGWQDVFDNCPAKSHDLWLRQRGENSFKVCQVEAFCKRSGVPS